MKNLLRDFYMKKIAKTEEIKRLQNRIDELENQLETVKAASASSEDTAGKQTLEAVGEVEKRLKLIQGIIKFRDQLLLFKDNAEEEGAAKLLSNLYRETGRILSINGVEVLNRAGDFLPDFQIAVDTITTDNGELVNKVESTFRDGYVFEGKMLRPQEVVVYVAGK